MEKLWDTVKAHPLLFTCIGAVVAIYFLWPSGTTSSSTSDLTAQEQAIAAAAQSSMQLAMASDQVQAVGITTAAQTAQNAANDAAAVQVATLQAGVATVNSNNALAYGQAGFGAQTTIAGDVLASQSSAQDFISSLEKAGLAVPLEYQTAGADMLNGGTSTTQPASILNFINSIGLGIPTFNDVTGAFVGHGGTEQATVNLAAGTQTNGSTTNVL